MLLSRNSNFRKNAHLWRRDVLCRGYDLATADDIFCWLVDRMSSINSTNLKIANSFPSITRAECVKDKYDRRPLAFWCLQQAEKSIFYTWPIISIPLSCLFYRCYSMVNDTLTRYTICILHPFREKNKWVECFKFFEVFLHGRYILRSILYEHITLVRCKLNTLLRRFSR